MLFLHLDGDDDFPVLGCGADHPMTMNSTPGGYVVENAGICTGHNEGIARFEFIDFILGLDHGLRTKQPSGIQLRFRHARILECLKLAEAGEIPQALPAGAP